LESEKFLGPSELAERWKKSPKWVYTSWRRLGLTPVRLGQALRFPLDEIVEWERKNRAR
jgi:hypothetical protein